MSSPPESVVSGLPKMWGMQHIQDLQARDGKLFQKEIARRLYSDLKGVVLDSLSTLRETTEGAPASYLEGLEHCRNWHPLVASEEMHRINARFKDLQVRVQAVSLLYGRILYAEQCKELGEPPGKKTLRMHAPMAESLVKGFFARACTAPWVRNGSFWKMDPFQQDFVLREAFRDALAQDCVLVTVQDASTEESGQLGSLSEDVKPEDSVSCIMEREEAPVLETKQAEAIPEEETTAEAINSEEHEAPRSRGASVASASGASASGAHDAPVLQALEDAPKEAKSVAPSVAPTAVSAAPSATSRLTAQSRKPIIVRLGSQDVQQ